MYEEIVRKYKKQKIKLPYSPLDFFLGDRLLIRFPLDCRCRSSSSEDDDDPELDDPEDPEELDEELRVGILTVLRATQRQVTVGYRYEQFCFLILKTKLTTQQSVPREILTRLARGFLFIKIAFATIFGNL